MPFRISPAAAQPFCAPPVSHRIACRPFLVHRRFLFVWFCGALSIFRASVALGQSDSPFAIRVDSREVIVPVVVFDRTRRVAAPGGRIELDEQITGLTPDDFKVSEDGVPQLVQRVAVELPRVRDVQDGVSHHMEYSFTPRGVWASPPLWPQTGTGPNVSLLSVYLLSYQPPLSSSGSCHRIQVAVKRKHATVHARDEYCNVAHSLSDPIGGARLGKQMEQFAGAAANSDLPVSLQVKSPPGNSSIAALVKFPAAAIKRKWVGVDLFAMVALLGEVRDRNGDLRLRFSDVLSTEPWNFYRGPLPPDRDFLSKWEWAAIPTQYETGIDLPPGDYTLLVVITDGEKFGKAELAFQVIAPLLDRVTTSDRRGTPLPLIPLQFFPLYD